MDHIIEVKNLKVSFRTNGGRLYAVRDLSFSLEQGETLAIVGESGSGKSVTSRAIMGILSPNASIDGGQIIFEGEDLLQLNQSQMCKIRRDKISMVFQDPLSSLNPIMKVGKQICEAILLKSKQSKKAARERAIKLMTEVGIPNPREAFEKYPFQFSGGQRQRIIIAIALASEPDLLICDEPTTALDVTIQAQILELIERLKRERNLSVIFITHDLGVVASVADKIAVMYAGKIVEYGTCDEIFYHPCHPYTWALLSSTPDLESDGRLEAIPGIPPDMHNPPVGDAFAPRNKYALKIDFEQEPPFFNISPTHAAATWLLHPNAPAVEIPHSITKRIKKMKETNHDGCSKYIGG
ncbi:MAG: ABC transporter ATP-binding protein [Ruminococcaceae bacterium]|nr:ABC transporter ATP-binding protein [Oscillospiraceae bacterium]